MFSSLLVFSVWNSYYKRCIEWLETSTSVREPVRQKQTANHLHFLGLVPPLSSKTQNTSQRSKRLVFKMAPWKLGWEHGNKSTSSHPSAADFPCPIPLDFCSQHQLGQDCLWQMQLEKERRVDECSRRRGMVPTEFVQSSRVLLTLYGDNGTFNYGSRSCCARFYLS